MVMNAFMRELLKRKMIEQGGTSPPPYTTPDMPSNVPGRAQVPDWVKQVSTPLPMQVLEGVGGLMNPPPSKPQPRNIWSTASPAQTQQSPNVMASERSDYDHAEEARIYDFYRDEISRLHRQRNKGWFGRVQKLKQEANEQLDFHEEEGYDSEWLTDFRDEFEVQRKEPSSYDHYEEAKTYEQIQDDLDATDDPEEISRLKEDALDMLEHHKRRDYDPEWIKEFEKQFGFRK